MNNLLVILAFCFCAISFTACESQADEFRNAFSANMAENAGETVGYSKFFDDYRRLWAGEAVDLDDDGFAEATLHKNFLGVVTYQRIHPDGVIFYKSINYPNGSEDVFEDKNFDGKIDYISNDIERFVYHIRIVKIDRNFDGYFEERTTRRSYLTSLKSGIDEYTVEKDLRGDGTYIPVEIEIEKVSRAGREKIKSWKLNRDGPMSDKPMEEKQ